MHEGPLQTGQGHPRGQPQPQTRQQGVHEQAHGQKRPPRRQIRVGQRGRAILEDDAAALDLVQSGGQIPGRRKQGPGPGQEAHHAEHAIGSGPQRGLPAKGQVRGRHADQQAGQGSRRERASGQMGQARGFPKKHPSVPPPRREHRGRARRMTRASGAARDGAPGQGKDGHDRKGRGPTEQHNGAGHETEQGLGSHDREQEQKDVDRLLPGIGQKRPRQGRSGQQPREAKTPARQKARRAEERRGQGRGRRAAAFIQPEFQGRSLGRKRVEGLQADGPIPFGHGSRIGDLVLFQEPFQIQQIGKTQMLHGRPV